MTAGAAAATAISAGAAASFTWVVAALAKSTSLQSTMGSDHSPYPNDCIGRHNDAT
jgi:hypothetical protein